MGINKWGVQARRILALGLALAAPAVLAAGNAEAGKGKAAVCMGCHGADGNSPADMWPKLAGQLPQYLSRQLHDFKAGRRKNEQMSPMAQPLSEQDIEDLAAFFSSQKVTPAEVKQKNLLASGEKIFLKGKGRPDVVPACVGCHGLTGTGKSDWAVTMKLPPTTLAPAIGGQHAAYVVGQLKAYKTLARNNDEAHVMRDVASRLSDQDIAAVAEYVAGLTR
ncbi:MAG: cytochrome c4 [Burkholderiales bacterium]|nr:cytochrome c4 [Burkholderiales bacterium]